VGTQDSAFLQQVMFFAPACILLIISLFSSVSPLTFPFFAQYIPVLILQASYITGGVYMKPQELSGLFQYLAVSYSSLVVTYLFGSVMY
jgi:hypothetical protein